MGKKGLSYIMGATYWQKVEPTGSVPSFLTINFAILLILYQRRIMYAFLMAQDEILQVYKVDAVAQCCITLQHHFITISSLQPFKEEHKGIVTSVTLATIWFTSIGILVCIWKKCKQSSSLM